MPLLPRAREARAVFAVAVLAALSLIALPSATAKKPWERELPVVPELHKEEQQGGEHRKALLLPQLPELLKLPQGTAPNVPTVTVPPAQVEPAKATQPSSSPAPVRREAPASSPKSGGSVGRSAPRTSSPARPTSVRRGAAGSPGRPARASASRAARRGRASAEAAARRPAPPRRAPRPSRDQGSSVTRTVRDIVEVVPRSVKFLLAALACLSAVLGGGYLLSRVRARRLDQQRGELLEEVGLLQAALLPSVPDTLGAVRPSVAYRPAEGLAAGGDFYDALELADGRSAFILGDVSGHGREALERTAFARYTLRAFLEAGLEPRVALQVAARVLGEHLGGEFVTVLLAIHDPADGSLTWANAGHPAPIVLGAEPFEPVTAGSSPPIGMGLDTGLRQTTIALPAGSVACMYTDGLVEARSDGHFMGRRGLEEVLEELGEDATASALIELVAARSGTASDDMAACLLTPAGDGPATAIRREDLVVSSADIERGVAARFLDACRVDDVPAVLHEAAAMAASHERAVLSVTFGAVPAVEVTPREGFDEARAEAASRRIIAA